MGAEYVTTRPMSIAGREFDKGEPVDPSFLDERKIAQLVELRHLRVVGGAALPPLVAMRSFDIGKRSFVRGDKVPNKLLTPQKRAQLLDHRYVEPLPVQKPATVQ